jgi:DNA polymerase III subunit gamma/tau
MEYQAIALKYRPKNFDEVVGQEQSVLALKNAISSGRIHHAYLFSGPRGVGKTSIARIFAKSLNCHKGPTVIPCNDCPSCLEISRGTSLDVIEIDGASNRGIDDIRSLRESVKLSPVNARYKVYIIDEVHQITTDGFNALLKTLEEPPQHVKFIFATTHPQKVLPTILSRCQKFQFSLVSTEKIVGKLKKITEAEKVKVEDTLIYTIARAGQGSLRDAESLLDQVLPVVISKDTLTDVFSFLGIVDEESLTNAIKYLVLKDLNSYLSLIAKIFDEGKDVGVFTSGMIEHLRLLLLAKVSPSNFTKLVDLSPQGKKDIQAIAESISAVEVLKLIDLLVQAKEWISRLNMARIPLEVAGIKYCYAAQIDQAKALAAVIPQIQNAVPSNDSKKPVVRSVPISVVSDLEKEIDDLDLGPMDKQAAPPVDSLESIDDADLEESSDNILLSEFKTRWPQIIVSMQKVRAAIASHIALATPVSSRGKVVTVGFSRKDYFHKEIVESSKNIKFIEGVAEKIIGRPIGIKFILLDNLGTSVAPVQKISTTPTPADVPAEDIEKSNDFLNDLMDTFKGSVSTDDTN